VTDDKLFVALIRYLEGCLVLRDEGSCDNCAYLVRCRAAWDGICSTLEDKPIHETKLCHFKARLDKLRVQNQHHRSDAGKNTRKEVIGLFFKK
jgi:hypothetical protein